jgi:PPK2 family polyphosphate:nucleotide phosphotransferase
MSHNREGWVLDRPHKVRLKEYDPDDQGGIQKAEGLAELDELGEELRELQALLYAAAHDSLLIVLQGPDGSGKDGTIRAVLDYVNPQGCHITSFKQPTPEEVSHDFLWRVHPHAPRRGMVSVFNRSHYEDVLVVRVHNLVPVKVWRSRYDQINAFEELLAASDTIILKFFLHISKQEQEERLRAREDDPEKAWKLSVADWKERECWEDYQAAYEEALERCSAPHAPWQIVPADHKWYRNVVVARALVKALRPHAADWRKDLEERGRQELEAIRALRGEQDK